MAKYQALKRRIAKLGGLRRDLLSRPPRHYCSRDSRKGFDRSTCETCQEYVATGWESEIFRINIVLTGYPEGWGIDD